MSTKWNLLSQLFCSLLSVFLLVISFSINLPVQAQELSFVKVYTNIEQKPQTLPPAPKLPKQLPKPIQNNFESLIIEKCKIYGCNAKTLIRIMKCESGGNPLAINRKEPGQPSGLFQHKIIYWQERAAKYGVPGASVFDPEANIIVTAQMYNKFSYMWACK